MVASASFQKIEFNYPRVAPGTNEAILMALEHNYLQGDGPHTAKVTQKLTKTLGSNCLLTHSCTGALEMAVMISEIGAGDEVIVPDFTFSSTASAVALRGAIPVFVDVDRETLNIDVNAVQQAITSKTKAIMVVHYGGVPADLEKLLEIAAENNLVVIEDAAQAIGVEFKGKALGTVGDFGCISFHATKNIQSGEGGLFISKSEHHHKKAEIIREKGTDRSAFLRGEVDRYTWREAGSSFLPSDLIAAYLSAQLEDVEIETARRRNLWEFYRATLEKQLAGKQTYIVAERNGKSGNGHIFAIVMPTLKERERFIKHMAESGISVVSHYVPLHSSPAGRKLGRSVGTLTNSIHAGDGLVRLPMHEGADRQRSRIANALVEFSFV